MDEIGKVRKFWFALRVKPRCETLTAAALDGKGFEQFLPLQTVRRKWSDRVKTSETPLFPGYVFCRFDPQNRLPVLTAPGVVDVVGWGKIPAPIPDEEIERVRRMVQSGLLVSPWPYLELGQAVLIERGPLAGMEGILVEVKGRCRLVVSINLLKRSISAEVERSCVRPVKSVASNARPAARRTG